MGGFLGVHIVLIKCININSFSSNTNSSFDYNDGLDYIAISNLHKNSEVKSN